MPEEQTRPPQGEEAEAERGPRCSKTLKVAGREAETGGKGGKVGWNDDLRPTEGGREEKKIQKEPSWQVAASLQPGPLWRWLRSDRSLGRSLVPACMRLSSELHQWGPETSSRGQRWDRERKKREGRILGVNWLKKQDRKRKEERYPEASVGPRSYWWREAKIINTHLMDTEILNETAFGGQGEGIWLKEIESMLLQN